MPNSDNEHQEIPEKIKEENNHQKLENEDHFKNSFQEKDGVLEENKNKDVANLKDDEGYLK